jgi:hypothetical protein
LNLDPLAGILQAKIPSLTGKVFIDKMPDSVVSGILLTTDYYGSHITIYTPGYVTGRFRLLSRDTTYRNGYDTAKECLEALTITQTVTTANMVIKQCLPKTLPISFPRTLGDTREFLVNFDLNYVEI